MNNEVEEILSTLMKNQVWPFVNELASLVDKGKAVHFNIDHEIYAKKAIQVMQSHMSILEAA